MLSVKSTIRWWVLAMVAAQPGVGSGAETRDTSDAGATSPYGRIPAWQGSVRPQAPTSRAGAFSFGSGSGRNVWSPQERAQHTWPSPRPSVANPIPRASNVPSGVPPRLEVSLSEEQPYVNQGVIYTVRVISSGNLRTIRPAVSGSDAFIVEKLAGPLTSVRNQGSGAEIVNEYRYLLTPIRPGRLLLPTARMSGTLEPVHQRRYAGYPPARAEASPFELKSQDAIYLDVRPAQSARVNPWLPLEDLRIEGSADVRTDLVAGQPFSFRVVLRSRGAGGDRLPSVQAQLRNSGFTVYREDVQTRRILSQDGQRISGIRAETYTLVPTGEQPARIPPLTVAWFNVGTGLREEAVLRASRAWSPATTRSRSDPASADAGFPFWVPFLLAFTAAVSYWLGMWFRGTRFGHRISQRLGEGLRRSGHAFNRHLVPVARYSSPRFALRAMRSSLAGVMPRSLRLWYCLRCIRNERDPAEWCQLFRFLACKHLEIERQTTLTDLADRITDAHPGARPAVVHALVRELDAAVYGGRSFDFANWKKRLSRQLRPVWVPRLFRRYVCKRGCLPSLNPQLKA